MQELLPVAVGVVVGLVSGRVLGRRAVLASLAVAPVLGVLVSWGVGELAESFAFAVLDTAVVGVTALIVLVAQRLVSRRAAPQSAGGARWPRSLKTKRT